MTLTILILSCSCYPKYKPLYIVNNNFSKSIVVKDTTNKVEYKISGRYDPLIYPPSTGSPADARVCIEIEIRNGSRETLLLDVRKLKLHGSCKYLVETFTWQDYPIVKVEPKKKRNIWSCFNGKCDQLLGDLTPEEWREARRRFVEKEELTLIIGGIRLGERELRIENIVFVLLKPGEKYNEPKN
jgi:hypothetical protein